MPSGLGRGLGSLIPLKLNNIIAATDTNFLSVPIEKIVANSKQPRSYFSNEALAELADSIKTHGILQPLVAIDSGNGYELIAGERRLRAAKLAGLKTVPVIVRTASEQQKLELALIENLQREDLNPIEVAVSYRQLIDEFKINQDELARRVSKPRPSVTNILRLLQLSSEIQDALVHEKITEAHAKYLLGLDEKQRDMVFHKIINHGLSVKDTDLAIKAMGGTKNARVQHNFQDQGRVTKLKEILKTKVEIKRTATGGKIIIDFYNDADLENIISSIH